ncbi:MAG: carbohydrate-binding domain-containing protein [Clostridiaceae bacterium]
MKRGNKNMIKRSIYYNLAVVLACTTVLYACSPKTATTSTTTETEATATTEAKASILGDKNVKTVISEVVTYESYDSYTDWKSENPNNIKLSGTTTTVEGSGAEVKDGKVTITSAGTYVISGKLDNGQIIVDVQDKGIVRLVLNGAEITSNDNAPIYVKNAGKTIVSLEEGADNKVTDGATYTLEDTSSDEPSAAIFSKDNLVINGTGSLTVNGNYKDGITSKDDLKITGGNIKITAHDDGLVGRDILAVKDGTITIEAGGDAFKSSNDEDSTKGIIAIENGTFNLKAEKDGIQADTAVLIGDGSFNITSGGGSVNGIKKAEEGIGGKDKAKTATTTTTETESKKAIKAVSDIGIAGGNFNIDSADDSIHSNNNAIIENGDFFINSGDDGIHADATLGIKNGKINITKSYEGIEASIITVSEGELHIKASDDGLNAGGGADGSSVNGRSGQNNFESSGSNKIIINGGYFAINAVSDGLDANGSISMTNGTVVISGANGGVGNGGLDYDSTFEITGGLLVSSGGAKAPSDSSSQYSIEMTYPQMQNAGTLVSLQDSQGNIIVTFAPVREYQSVVISSPELKKGESYTLYSGGSSTGTVTDGFYKDGKYENGTKVVSFTISNSVTWLNESGITSAQSSKGGGKGGQRGQKPTTN